MARARASWDHSSCRPVIHLHIPDPGFCQSQLEARGPTFCLFGKNEILCSSFDWWIINSYLIQIPEQIIIPLLPIPNMSEPINAITVSHKKKLSQDWFRDFFLPQARIKLERSISPLRRNSGKLIILDGRANKRNWGRLLLQNIQPSKQINYVLPFD